MLNRVVRQRGLAERSSHQALQDLWKSSVEARVAEKSFVRKFRAGVLEIGVTNGAILEELNSYLKHDVLETLRQKHPEPEIEIVKFVKA